MTESEHPEASESDNVTDAAPSSARPAKVHVDPATLHPYADRVKEQRRVRILAPDALRHNDKGLAGGRAVIWAYGRSFLRHIALLDTMTPNGRSFWKNRRVASGIDENDMFEAIALAVRTRLDFRPDRSGALSLVAAALHHLANVLAGRDLVSSRVALRKAAIQLVESTAEDGTVQGASTLPADVEPE